MRTHAEFHTLVDPAARRKKAAEPHRVVNIGVTSDKGELDKSTRRFEIADAGPFGTPRMYEFPFGEVVDAPFGYAAPLHSEPGKAAQLSTIEQVCPGVVPIDDPRATEFLTAQKAEKKGDAKK